MARRAKTANPTQYIGWSLDIKYCPPSTDTGLPPDVDVPGTDAKFEREFRNLIDHEYPEAKITFAATTSELYVMATDPAGDEHESDLGGISFLQGVDVIYALLRAMGDFVVYLPIPANGGAE